jgi:hypothetical protein
MMAEQNKDKPAPVQQLEDIQAERPTTAEQIEASRETLEAERKERMKPAKIAAAPAEAFEASGAVQEPTVTKAIDVDHPAVDNNPRAGTTEAQNRIDFNDPTQSDREAVAERLENQG